jgi:hypothetical protein
MSNDDDDEDDEDDNKPVWPLGLWVCLMPLLYVAVCGMRYVVCGLHHCVLSSVSEY